MKWSFICLFLFISFSGYAQTTWKTIGENENIEIEVDVASIERIDSFVFANIRTKYLNAGARKHSYGDMEGWENITSDLSEFVFDSKNNRLKVLSLQVYAKDSVIFHAVSPDAIFEPVVEGTDGEQFFKLFCGKSIFLTHFGEKELFFEDIEAFLLENSDAEYIRNTLHTPGSPDIFKNVSKKVSMTNLVSFYLPESMQIMELTLDEMISRSNLDIYGEYDNDFIYISSKRADDDTGFIFYNTIIISKTYSFKDISLQNITKSKLRSWRAIQQLSFQYLERRAKIKINDLSPFTIETVNDEKAIFYSYKVDNKKDNLYFYMEEYIFVKGYKAVRMTIFYPADGIEAWKEEVQKFLNTVRLKF